MTASMPANLKQLLPSTDNVCFILQVLERRQDIARKAHTTVIQAETQLKQLTEDT